MRTDEAENFWGLLQKRLKKDGCLKWAHTCTIEFRSVTSSNFRFYISAFDYHISVEHDEKTFTHQILHESVDGARDMAA